MSVDKFANILKERGYDSRIVDVAICSYKIGYTAGKYEEKIRVATAELSFMQNQMSDPWQKPCTCDHSKGEGCDKC